MLDDNLKTYALVGEDIANSFLSTIQNSVFDELSLDACYIPFSVKKEDLKSSVEILRESFAGFNVASPYKRAIAKYIDVLDDKAKTTGTVNTVKCVDGVLYGYNTDTKGFLDSLIGEKINFFDKDILIIGTGGTAKSIAHVLLDKGAFLTIVTRDFGKAMAFKEELQTIYNKNRIRVIKGVLPSEKFFAIINAASVELETRFSDMAIHDETYKELKYIYEFYICQTSFFLKKALEYGIQYKNGLDMLFYSALASQKIWLGEDLYSKLNVAALEKIKDQLLACSAA